MNSKASIPKILAVIPARGGSKGIHRKNLVEINDIPLIGYSIEHAQKSQTINRIVVSTEDPEIKAVALRFGAEVIDRPMELAEDHVLDLPVFEHVLKQLAENEGYKPDLIVHLRPTSPYRQLNWIDDAVKLLSSHPDADSVRSVSSPEKHPYRMFYIGQDGYLDPIMKHEHPMPYLLRRQDLPDVFYYNCVIDVTRPETIKLKASMTGDKILPLIMNPSDVFDLDTPQDLQMIKEFLRNKL